MAQQTTFMTLPPELRERVYEYIACSHSTRRIQTLDDESGSRVGYRTTTSAITATCCLVHREYGAVAKKSTTVLEFTATNWDFTPVMDYFYQQVDPEYLASLQQNKAIIIVNISITNQNYHRDVADFFPLALLLINVKLEHAYRTDTDTWMEIHIANNNEPELVEQCLVKTDTPDEVRDNIEKIRNLVEVFDREVWIAYPKFFKAMQRRYRQEWNRRDAETNESRDQLAID